MICASKCRPSPSDELHAHLEAEIRDALDERLLGAVLRQRREHDVVRADELAAKLRRLADEREHELVRRPLVEILRRADLLHAAVVHEHDVVGDLHRLLLVVRDEHRRHVHLVVQTAQPVAQLLPHARVERAERLVEQQHLGLDGERARERHPLPLPAGELRGIALAEPLELHELEQLVHALADLLLRTPPHRQPERDVVGDRHVLERRVVLEDEADAALLRPQAASPRGRR